MVNEEKLEEGLTLKDIFQIIKKHIVVILICVIGFSALGYVYSNVKAPTYKANATVLVQYEGGDSNTAITTEYSYSKYISDTLVVFIKEEIVLQKVVDKAKVAGYYADSELDNHQIMKSIASKISVSNEALILSISYQDTEPDRTLAITNFICEAAQEVADSVDSSGEANYYLLKDNLRVLSPATRSTAVSNTVKNVVIFFAVGCVIAFVYVLLRELFDKSFKSGDDIERTLGIPVIATIPDYDIDAILSEGGK